MTDNDEQPDKPEVPELDLVPEAEINGWRDPVEARMDELEDGETEVPGHPLEPDVDAMRRELLRVIADAPTVAPQRYGYVLTWGLVPEMLLEMPPIEHDGHMLMRKVFYVLTPGGEFLALNRAMMQSLNMVLSRLCGTSEVMDMEPGWGTWSTAPGMPITQLDILFMLIEEPRDGVKARELKSDKLTVNAHIMGEPLYLTCPKKPDGWPL